MHKKLIKLAKLLVSNKMRISVAESCTGGALASCLTNIPGSSQYFDSGFITYSNSAKVKMLGVSIKTIADHGAVSENTVLEMLLGVTTKTNSNLAVAISGIAGPSGGSAQKPVGTVCFAFNGVDKNYSITKLFSGDRDMIIKKSVSFAIDNFIILASCK